jgi:hypothetical protein
MDLTSHHLRRVLLVPPQIMCVWLLPWLVEVLLRTPGSSLPPDLPTPFYTTARPGRCNSGIYDPALLNLGSIPRGMDLTSHHLRRVLLVPPQIMCVWLLPWLVEVLLRTPGSSLPPDLPTPFYTTARPGRCNSGIYDPALMLVLKKTIRELHQSTEDDMPALYQDSMNVESRFNSKTDGHEMLILLAIRS